LQALQRLWRDGLASAATPIEQENGQDSPPFSNGTIRAGKPGNRRRNSHRIRFGELQVDLKRITDKFPPNFSCQKHFRPACLIPRHASLLIHTDQKGRLRPFALCKWSCPSAHAAPRRARAITIIDPSPRQNFADSCIWPIMMKRSSDRAFGRIPTHQSAALRLTEHMETVIQKYLRNEFETIDDYNAQPGIGEPYRFW